MALLAGLFGADIVLTQTFGGIERKKQEKRFQQQFLHHHYATQIADLGASVATTELLAQRESHAEVALSTSAVNEALSTSLDLVATKASIDKINNAQRRVIAQLVRNRAHKKKMLIELKQAELH